MKIYEKSLELNVGAEIINFLRKKHGMSKLYLRGLTQREEKAAGVDFFAQLNPKKRLFAFQFKAPKGTKDDFPYRFTLQREQHTKLYRLSRRFKGAVYYVFPFYSSHTKVQNDVPNLLQDTWALKVAPMKTKEVFGKKRSKTIRCCRGIAKVNPEYEPVQFSELELETDLGIPPKEFANWYSNLRDNEDEETKKVLKYNPWLVRGLRIAIVGPN